jgi:hypothetical protein
MIDEVIYHSQQPENQLMLEIKCLKDVIYDCDDNNLFFVGYDQNGESILEKKMVDWLQNTEGFNKRNFIGD